MSKRCDQNSLLYEHPYKDEISYYWWCPGCKEPHIFTTSWTIENLNPLTVSPSILTSIGASEERCHVFIKNGMIQFLNDCWHELKGQTVPMTDFPPGFKE